jgi:hypothetical protein
MGDTRRFSGSYRRPGRVILRVADGPDQGKQVRLELADSRSIRGGRSEVNERTVAEDMAEAERTGTLWEGDRVALIYSEAMDKVATVWQVEVNDDLWSPEVQLAWRVTPKNGRVTFFSAGSEVRPGVVRPALRAALRGLQGP